MYSNFKKAITQIFNEYLHWAVEIRIILDYDWPGPASNGDAVVVTSLKTNPEDSRGGNGEDPEQAMLRTRLNLPVKFLQFFTECWDFCFSYCRNPKIPQFPRDE
ncbi:hypothetical protein RchiOBHm_Chr6g0260081 [Rosa chinensis]|uniref:Uncharacterized protein n=1 Tax=Rosa chinensis TaxID=74649 RepID=A0A2P6PN39_ROSCH|nr:hypothetical protein RchiOBHm_Chr6g0260081 [Rosa chinensis]